MEKGNQSRQMKKGKGGGEVNESIPTRIQFLHICEVMKDYQQISNQLQTISDAAQGMCLALLTGRI